MEFTCSGHKNILAKHRNTFEFTYDKELTPKGDCIVGVNANYKLEDAKQFINQNIKITIQVDNCKDEITAQFNNIFNDKHEMVIRVTPFVDTRTFAINANKAAKDLSRELIKKMKKPDAVMKITINTIEHK